MKPKNVRTTIELPRELHRRLLAEADRRGCSMRNVIVDAIERAIVPTPPKRGRLNLEHGLVRRTGKPISITTDEIYRHYFP